MTYIVVETFPAENSMVVVNEEGTAKLFDTLEAAEAEAADCQCGVVLEV